jgi:pimeloyl-ACP methyl ester carboxylesterase
MAQQNTKIEGMSLDNPHVDKAINAGTTAANCQPRHTRDAMSVDDSSLSDGSTTGEGSSTSSRRLSRSERNVVKREQKAASAKKKKDAEDPKKMGYVQMAKMGYQELVNAIIRPPRAEYKEETLGPPAFLFCSKRFTRTDFALKTKRGLNLQCSHWEPVERASDRIPVVIYMHGNSSARVEVLPQLSYLLSLGIAVFSFDFAGSGKSDGEYVSLGYHEREDLMCVIAHLRATNVVSTIALWGRSMGAATALMHGYRDPSIACMILDSPFSDLSTLAEEMVDKGREQGIAVPGFVVIALRMIRSSVKKQAGVDIRQISPIAHADKCFIPALFVAGEHDDFINKRHSEEIHARYAGDKNMIVVEGDHNSPRPKFMFDSVSIFLQTCLQIPQSWALNTHPGMNLMAPPWLYPGVSRPSAAARQRSTSASANNQNGPPEEIGMTAERQREIQASLFKMLGQQDDDNGNDA